MRNHNAWGLPACCVLLIAICATAFLPAAYVAHGSYGSEGVTACAVACGLCLGAASLALVATSLLRRSQNAIVAIMVGMFLRTALPLAGAVVLSIASPSLARGGVFGATLVFFLVALVAETSLSVYLIKADEAGRVV